MLLAGVVLVAGLVWASAIGYIASTTLMYGDAEKHGCPTPAELGWAYEAVNYDIALDEQLPDDNPNWLKDCPNHGAGTAGTDVVSADGVRLAGWYIPSGDGDAASAPTVVIVHGWGVSKSDALRYAVPLHDNWNLLLIDTRAQGRSGGDWMSFGVREVDDVRAMLDWLERTKHPSKIAVSAIPAGAAASAKLARTDPAHRRSRARVGACAPAERPGSEVRRRSARPARGGHGADRDGGLLGPDRRLARGRGPARRDR